MNRLSCQIVFVLLAALSASSVASAQVIRPPSRQARLQQPPGQRATSDLVLEANLLGGYDENPIRVSSNVIPIAGQNPPTREFNGYMGVLDAGLLYRRGSASRSLAATGRSFMNAYKNYGLKPSYGGDVAINADTSLGRGNTVQGTVAGQNSPYFSLGLFGPLGGVGGNPNSALTTGRTWHFDTAASLRREWTRNTTTSLGYVYGRTGYTGIAIGGAAPGQSVGPFNNDTHSGTADLDRELGRTMSSRLLYRHSINSSIQVGGRFRPITHDTIEGRLSYTRDLSRTRQISLSGGGGGAYVQASAFLTGAPYEYWAPLYYGSTVFDFNRTWSTAAEYRRTVVVLPALNNTVAQQAYVAHQGTLSLGGMVTSFVEFALSAAYSNGRTGAGVAIAGPVGEYEAYTGTAQLQFRLTDWWFAMLNVSHVETILNPAASQALGISPQFRRNSVRVGLAWELPLIGPRGGAPGQRRRG